MVLGKCEFLIGGISGLLGWWFVFVFGCFGLCLLVLVFQDFGILVCWFVV